MRVTSPISRSVTVTGDARIPGHHVFTVGYQVAPASTELAGTDTVRIVLTGLTSPVRVGFSYPVVFVFEQAGDLHLKLPVENPNTPRSPALQLPHDT